MGLVVTPKNCDVSVKKAIQQLSLKLSALSSPTFTGLTLTGLTASRLTATDSSKALSSVTDLTDYIAGTMDHISVADDADGTVTLDLDTNTKTLLGSFNGIFLEKLDFTISEAAGTVTGSLEQDSGGDLIQRFSDGYTTLDCTPALTIDLTAYVGSNAVPKEVFVYILQSAKTVMAASNSDWPATEHIKIAHLVLKSAATTGTDGGALVNQNVNDFASAANGEGHISHVEERLRKEPARWDSGTALTLKNAAGAALTAGNSSTAVELVIATGQVYQLHRHTWSAFDMYVTATDDAHVVNQPTDEGGAYETTADLVTDVTRYVDGTAAGVTIGTNKYFNLVIWGIQNRMGEVSHVMINLPTGQYTTEAAAIADSNGTSVFDIPNAFEGTGFLIARLTFRLIGGAQWTYIAQEDLRGKSAPISAGVSVSTTAHDLLSNLDFASAAHTGFQAQGDVLDDLNTLGANAADSEFLVGTGAGAFAWEANTTVRISLGLGTGDSPQFTGIELGHASDTTLTRASAGNLNIEGKLAYRVDGIDVAIADGGTGQSTAQLAINSLSAVSGATNEHVLTKDTGTGNATFKAATGGSGITDGWEKIYENEIAGSAVTTFTISGLDGNVDEVWMFVVKAVGGHGAGVCSYQFFLNNDSGANYGYCFLNADGTNVTTGNSTAYTAMDFTGACAVGTQSLGHSILYAKSGQDRTAMRYGMDRVNTTKSINFLDFTAFVWDNTADNITSIVCTASIANGWGVGSHMIMYRKKN